MDIHHVQHADHKEVQVKKEEKKVHKRLSIYTIMVLILILVVLVVGIKYLGIYIRYNLYTEKMQKYGLTDNYNNGEGTSYQKVTKSEMVKIVLCSISGQDNVLGYIPGYEKTYENSEYVKCAETLGIIKEGYITEKNENEKANYIETGIIIVNTVEKLLDRELELTGESIYTNMGDYPNYKIQVVKAGDNGIYDYSRGKLREKDLIKGQLNKMLVPIIEKYATLYHSEGKDVKIVTNKSELPENEEIYPYILSSINKEVYEMPLACYAQDRYMSPIDEYKYRGEIYSQIDEYITKYFEAILNVNYKTINRETFLDSIKDTLYYEYTEDSMDEYIEYVKANKIQLSGKCEVLLPIIYNDGEENRVRVHVNFKIKNGKTNLNLLMPDIFGKDNIKYTTKYNDFYMDIPMGLILNSKTLKMKIVSLPDYIISDNVGIIRLEK